MTKQQIIRRIEDVKHIHNLRENEKLNNPKLMAVEWMEIYERLKGFNEGVETVLNILRVWLD